MRRLPMALLCMAARCTNALRGAVVRNLRGVMPAHRGGLAAALQKRRTSPAALQHRWTTHLAATGDAAVDAIDADAALQTVSDAQWAPILQDIRDKAGQPGAVAAAQRRADRGGRRQLGLLCVREHQLCAARGVQPVPGSQASTRRDHGAPRSTRRGANAGCCGNPASVGQVAF